jgi:hypothetical protein
VDVFHGSASGLGASPSRVQTGGYRFGNSVASAGDVNGDGYTDVITGSYQYDVDGRIDAGRVDLYLGSDAGLSLAPSWTRLGAQDSANYGFKAAGAGDVNGDGYGDVIVGAWLTDAPVLDQGQAFLYMGSAAGLDTLPAWTAKGEGVKAQFGQWVNSAGDVNGDGFSDVIVGSNKFSGPGLNAGRAYVYLGSPLGLEAEPTWTFTGSSGDFVGTVATAGDVNCDGYSDVLVGAPMYTNGETEEGIVALFLGSPTGPSATADWSFEGGRPLARMGEGVASAGDVNGDGFADVIIGSNEFTNPLLREGAAFLFLGNKTDGIDRLIRQSRVSLVRPIVAPCLSDEPDAFRLTATVRSPFGRTDVALEYEAAPLGTPLDGTSAVVGTFTDTGVPSGSNGSSQQVAETVNGWSPGDLVHWRARFVTRSPIFPRTPWTWPVSNAVSEADVRMPGAVKVSEPPLAGARGALPLFDAVPTVGAGPITLAARAERAVRLVRIAVYDATGSLVRVLDAGGASSVTWDCRDAQGRLVAGGVYAVRASTSGGVSIRRVVVRR